MRWPQRVVQQQEFLLDNTSYRGRTKSELPNDFSKSRQTDHQKCMAANSLPRALVAHGTFWKQLPPMMMTKCTYASDRNVGRRLATCHRIGYRNFFILRPARTPPGRKLHPRTCDCDTPSLTRSQTKSQSDPRGCRIDSFSSSCATRPPPAMFIEYRRQLCRKLFTGLTFRVYESIGANASVARGY